jgi:CxxC motif-containing protein
MRELLCIVCPNGCRLQVEETGDEITVSGNQCGRGIPFARAEIRNPTRTLTTTVRTLFPEVPVLPVRTDGEIPKGSIRDAMRFLNTLTIGTRIGAGSIVVKNILDLGCNVIATSNILLEQEGKNRLSGGGDKHGGTTGIDL